MTRSEFEREWGRIVNWVFLIAVFVFMFVFLCLQGDSMINSDMSSEMILGKLLRDENAVITKNWYYSTEMRILNFSLLYSFFLRIFQDWTAVRIAASMTVYALMLLSYFYLLYQAGCKKYFAASAVFLFLPLSDGYYEYVLWEISYGPFISSSFFAVGMLLHYDNAKEGWKRGCLLAGSALFAFVSSLAGARYLVILCCPMLMAVVLKSLVERRRSRMLLCAAVSFVVSVIGYLINSCIFSRVYHFMTWDNISLRFSLQGVTDMFFGTLRVFGYSYGEKSMPAASAFAIFFAGVTAFLILRYVVKNLQKPDGLWFMAVYILCAYLLFLGIYTFTNMLYGDRYGMLVIVFVIPILFVSISTAEWKPGIKRSLAVILTGGVLISSVVKYTENIRADVTAELRQVTDYLVEEEVAEGYATLWNGNVLTELSDDFIEVWCLNDKYENVDDLLKWLQLTAHDTQKPEGRLFLLLTREEYDVSPFRADLEEREADFETDTYVMFLFDSYEEMKKEFSTS